MAVKKTAAAPRALTPDQVSAAKALLARERIVAKADRARATTEALADAGRDYVAGAAGAALVGLSCTGTFLKRLVFGAPKISVPTSVVESDAQLRAVLKRHGML